MTYEELVEKVNQAYENADATGIKEHVAVQFNVYGEGEGAFYVEVIDGKVAVAPYEYYDHDAIVIAPANTVVDMVEGKVSVADTYALEHVQVVGNVGKAALLGEIKKAAAKVAQEKTTKVATEEKPAEEKTTKTAAKTTKTTAKKTTKTSTKKAAKAAAKTTKATAAKTTTAKTATAKKDESSQLKLEL
ncbi:MAG: SCP2 sterol-binding domain-containing protein [Lachnospiraceae bacterium]|nr:SCP2 sterol-binding domain-containing protein [Lachnospiraceae bacterium]MEE1102246.1 SCP2 sterol-binding domain-containing protein [Agathobacter sp.]